MKQKNSSPSFWSFRDLIILIAATILVMSILSPCALVAIYMINH